MLQCPEAAQQYVHIVGYVANMVAFPGKVYERQALGPGKDIIKPAILTQLFPHNALVWDTSVSNGLENNVGYLLGADLDGQRFWTPDVPQHRYYDPADVYAKLQGGALGNQKPVRFNVGSPVWKNIDPHDPDDGGPGYPYQGNMRFRHNKNTACNVGFADGSVRQYVGKFKGNGEMQSHDAIRKDFMIKWPSGLARNNQVP